MANYTTDLKTWGSTGEEHPDNYNYVEGEQPVDAWDNWLNTNIITDIDHLVSLTNARLESSHGGSHPSSPEVGELSYRTDSPGPGSNEQLFVYDDSAGVWRRFLSADGDSLSGDLNVNSQSVLDASEVTFSGEAFVGGSSLDTQWFSKQEGGTVSDGDMVPIGAFELDDGESLHVSQATLLADGYTEPAANGLDLIIADENAANDTDTTTILSGDGSTHHVSDESGWEYENTSGGSLTVSIALDNGHFNAGSGGSVNSYGGYIARVE